MQLLQEVGTVEADWHATAGRRFKQAAATASCQSARFARALPVVWLEPCRCITFYVLCMNRRQPTPTNFPRVIDDVPEPGSIARFVLHVSLHIWLAVTTHVCHCCGQLLGVTCSKRGGVARANNSCWPDGASAWVHRRSSGGTA